MLLVVIYLHYGNVSSENLSDIDAVVRIDIGHYVGIFARCTSGVCSVATLLVSRNTVQYLLPRNEQLLQLKVLVVLDQ